jgi:hypothetical protein
VGIFVLLFSLSLLFCFSSYQSISKRGDRARWDIGTGCDVSAGYAGTVVITVGIFWRDDEVGECEDVGVGDVGSGRRRRRRFSPSVSPSGSRLFPPPVSPPGGVFDKMAFAEWGRGGRGVRVKKKSVSACAPHHRKLSRRDAPRL